MEKKKVKLFSAIALVALALLVVGATYAYFQNQYGAASNADVKVTTYTTDVLTFETGDGISITADQENFAQGKGNQTGSTYASALLKANNKTNTATEHYYMYLNITTNSFKYTIDENTPEIIMTVTDSEGNEITSVDGLTYVTAQDASGVSITGFDITTKDGLVTIFNNREITASPNTEEKWNITITFVNYDKDQTKNAGESMSSKIIIQKGQLTLSDYVIVQYTGIQGENNLYHHDGTLTNGINDGSYRYAGASDMVNNFVCFGSDAETCPTDNLYRIIGVFGNQVKLIKYDYATSSLLGTDGDYYGTYSSGTSCYYWNKNATTDSEKNTWSLSLLNKTNLNTNFINNIGSTWVSKIATTTWKVGGNTWENVANTVPPTAYQNEIANPDPTSTSKTGEKEYSAKIGLMYVSDYAFAAAPSAWTRKLAYYSGNGYSNDAVTSVNWMYMGHHEWTISRISGMSGASGASEIAGYGYAFDVYNWGCVNYNYVGGEHAVRPTFYLLASVNFAGGDGSQNLPFRLS